MKEELLNSLNENDTGEELLFEITSIINPREVFTIVNHLWRDFKDTKQENNRTYDNTKTDAEDV